MNFVGNIFLPEQYCTKHDAKNSVLLNLFQDGTFTSYELADESNEYVLYAGTYNNYGLLVLNYTSYTVNSKLNKIKDYKDLEYVNDNIYRKNIKKTGYIIRIGDRLLKLSDEITLLMPDYTENELYKNY